MKMNNKLKELKENLELISELQIAVNTKMKARDGKRLLSRKEILVLEEETIKLEKNANVDTHCSHLKEGKLIVRTSVDYNTYETFTVEEEKAEVETTATQETQNQIEKILGFEVVEIERTGAELIEESTIYNEEETISVEKLTDDTYYVLSREDKDSDWEIVGYFKEV